MLSKNVIKDIQSLSHKKHRSEAGLFIAEGPKIVYELVKLVPEYFETIYSIEECPPFLKDAGIQCHHISEAELVKISQLQTPNQVLAVLKQFPESLPEIQNEVVLYLDAIQDPGNFGTLIRIADWFGIKKIICSSGCADLYNPKVVQSTMASIARVAVWYDEDDNWLSKQSVSILAATLHGKSIYNNDKLQSGILLIGNESKGVRPEFQSLATHKVTIPRIGDAESLNAAVATGIILSHLLPS
jgi:TrmH family RNA methyltransferase